MSLKRCSDEMLPALEEELHRQVRRLDTQRTQSFHAMLTYHMGWTGDGAGPAAAGKRVRPLLLLLVTSACRGEWRHALGPACAVEIIHNFSLVHDDIEDNSPTRRGRVTLWKKHGVPMAINAGDALFALADLAVLDAASNFPADTVLRAALSLHVACLSLTGGQYLDMSYEKRRDITVEDYWPMVEGKTAALLRAAAEIGAILGEANERAVEQYADFARKLGLAFQVQDDILGIWGDESATGKSAASDLVEGKNSLPVLYGLGKHGAFAERWAAGPILPQDTRAVAQQLRDEGAYDFAAGEAARLTGQAMVALDEAAPQGEAGRALRELAAQLLQRNA